MTPAEAITGISSGISILGLIILIFWLYRNYRIDTFRQQMFALRDEVFDYVEESGVGFETRAYGVLRTTMNGYIRFAHRISLLHLLLFAVVTRHEIDPDSRSFEAIWTEATNAVPKQIAEKLDAYRERLNMLVVKHLVLNSPVLVAMVIPALVGFVLADYCVTWLSKVLRPELDGIDVAAFAYGQ